MKIRSWFDDHKLFVYFVTSTGSIGVWIITIALLLDRASTAQTAVAIGLIILCYTVIMGFVTVTSCIQDSITEERTTMIEEHTLTRAVINTYLRETLASRIVRETLEEVDGEIHAKLHH